MSSPQPRFSARARWIIRLVFLLLLSGSISGFLAWMVVMPGVRHQGPLGPLDADGQALQARLEAHVGVLARDIGPRNVLDGRAPSMAASADHIAATWQAQGYEVTRQPIPIQDGIVVENLEITLPGAVDPSRIILVGAHYDTHADSPGASDNASGVAILLELSREAASWRPASTVRFVAFANEELPFARTELMGSLFYARAARARGDNIVSMWSLETLGNYSDAPGSQRYSFPFSAFYPDRGNFVAFIGDLAARGPVTEAVGAFRQASRFPCEGLAAPGWLAGTYRSDQWAFWMVGYPGMMITDTANFRYDHYHTPDDLPETLEYAHMAHLTLGLSRVLESMAMAPASAP